MRKKYVHYIPPNDAELAVWAGNFDEKITDIALILGMKQEDVNTLKTATSNIKTAVSRVEVKRNEFDNAVAAMEESRKKDVQLLVNAAVTIKRNANYLPSMGSELGIIGTSQGTDIKSLKPALKARAYPGKVVLQFKQVTSMGKRFSSLLMT